MPSGRQKSLASGVAVQVPVIVRPMNSSEQVCPALRDAHAVNATAGGSRGGPSGRCCARAIGAATATAAVATTLATNRARTVNRS